MKKILYFILTVLAFPAVVLAQDIDVFSDCGNALPPNLLILMDTSLSMRNEDVYDDAILDYSHEKTDWSDSMPYDSPYKMMFKESEDVLFWSWFGYGDPWDEIECAEAKEALKEKGFYKGELCHSTMKCKTVCTEKLVVMRNYLNYLDYVEKEMKKISFGKGACSSIAGAELETYCPNTDYYNYHGDGMGYGDYGVAKDLYSKEKDRAYVKMGMIRPYNSVIHPGGIKVEDIDCDSVRNDLLANGWAKGKLWEAGDSSCIPGILKWIAPTKLLMTKNFLNYLDMKRSRRYNGIDALYRVIEKRHTDVNFGIMQFDLGHYLDKSTLSNLTPLTIWKSDGGDLSAPCGSDVDDLKRVLYKHYTNTDSQYGQSLMFGFQGIVFKDSGKDTPLAESLVEAGLYFAGQPSWFNDYTINQDFFNTDRPVHSGTTSGRRYMSPIECPDQGNHIVVITDGSPSDDFQAIDISNPNQNLIKTGIFRTYDEASNEVLPDSECTIGNYDGDSDDCAQGVFGCYDVNFKQAWLDDVAAYLFERDLSPLEGKQSVQTHAISFRMDADAPSANRKLLNDTAINGGGVYAVTKTKDELEKALLLITGQAAKTATFSSAVTPVRQDDLVYSGDRTLLTRFEITSGERGKGNVCVYRREGDVIYGLDKDNKEIELFGAGSKTVFDIYSKTISNRNDREHPVEGVAGLLYKRILGLGIDEGASWQAKLDAVASNRKILGVDSKHGNQVRSFKELARAGAIEIPKTGGTAPNDLYYSGDHLNMFLARYLYGLDNPWPLGHIVHPDVVVAQYPDSTKSSGFDARMFVGANDGMIHCFDMASGQELWALVPPDQIERLRSLEDTINHPWFMDGEMVLYRTAKEVGSKWVMQPSRLLLGERRGGRSFHILDIENKGMDPVYKAQVGPSLGFEGKTFEFGQSWSRPVLCQVKTGTEKKKGFLVGGGYDVGQDSDTPGADSQGKFVALMDIDGSPLKIFDRYELTPGVYKDIEACVVGARIVDHDHDESRLFSRVYAGDLKGNVYHFADDLRAEGGDYVSRSSSEIEGLWDVSHKLFTCGYNTVSNGFVNQKVMYAPMLGSACKSNMIFIGTGDREKPNSKSIKDSVYGIKESWTGDAVERDELVRFDLSLPSGHNSDVNLEEYTATAYVKKDGGNEEEQRSIDFENYKGWYFDFFRDGEKVVSEIQMSHGVLVFGTYTPKSDGTKSESAKSTTLSERCQNDGGCKAGQGRIYVVSACPWNFKVRSEQTGIKDPMPQPAIILDEKTGKVLITAGDGKVIDPGIPVIKPEFWKSSVSM